MIMKSKLFSAVILAIFLVGSSFAQAQDLKGPKSNAPAGADNFYKNLYGQTGSSRGAKDALVFVDLALQNDFVVAALTNQGFTVTVAVDWSDFNAKLASGNYGFAVAFNQNNGLGLSYEVTQSYIRNGGCMIFDDWTMNNSFANLFEAGFTGATNMSPMTISDAILAGGVTNPLPLSNAGWGTWVTGLSAIGSGQVLATFPNGNAAVVRGNGGHTIILGYLSDAPLFSDRQLLFENVIDCTSCGKNVPISKWAIGIGIFLMLSFVVIRYFRMS